MEKVPKMAVFLNFAPGNLKNEKNDIAYHVGFFFSKILAKIVELKNACSWLLVLLLCKF